MPPAHETIRHRDRDGRGKTGQKREARVLLRAVWLYLAKRLDVDWGSVKPV